MVEFRDVSYSYTKSRFIERLNLTIENGKITALIGPNGCGKSTLLKMGSGIIEPQYGRVLYRGEDIQGMKPKEYARKTAVLLQTNRPPAISVESYVMAGRYPHQAFGGMPSEEDRDIVRRAMNTTGCAGFKHRDINRLSGGERQKAFIAMAVAQDTEVIFLDEPTTHLDIHVGFEIMNLVVELNKSSGKTIVMVLHDLNLALNYSHNVVLMESGSIVAQEPSGHIAKTGKIEKVFGVGIKNFEDGNRGYYCFEPVKRAELKE